MALFKIILMNAARETIHEREFDTDDVQNTSIVKFEGRMYVYSHSSGPYFNEARFVEVAPPLELE